MSHRVLVVVTTAFAIVLSVATSGQRGAVEPPGSAGRMIGRSQMTVVSGSLTGTVRDQSRALVQKVQVTVTLETDANVQPHRTTTDVEGRFRFTGLPLGSYCLTVDQNRSEVASRTGIQVRGAQTTNVPIVLGERTPTPSPGVGSKKQPQQLRGGCGS